MPRRCVLIVMDSSLLQNDTSVSNRYDDNFHTFHSRHGSVVSVFEHSGVTPYGLFLDFSGADPDNRVNYFQYAQGTGTARYIVYSDGDVVNHDFIYGNI